MVALAEKGSAGGNILNTNRTCSQAKKDAGRVLWLKSQLICELFKPENVSPCGAFELSESVRTCISSE